MSLCSQRLDVHNIMSEDPSEPNATDSDSSAASQRPDPPEWEAGLENPSAEGSSASFALEGARLWVQQHQKASMLGAFAVGVFVGAMLRD